MADSESGSPEFLFEFSISLSFGDIRVWQRDGRTDNADHYYSWPPHCGGPANNILTTYILHETVSEGSIDMRAATFLLQSPWTWPRDLETWPIDILKMYIHTKMRCSINWKKCKLVLKVKRQKLSTKLLHHFQCSLCDWRISIKLHQSLTYSF